MPCVMRGSAKIVSRNGVPIIVERAMYLSTPGQFFGAGHASAAVTAPALEWFLAEGATGNYFNLYYLLANPNAITAPATGLLPNRRPNARPITHADPDRRPQRGRNPASRRKRHTDLATPLP